MSLRSASAGVWFGKSVSDTAWFVERLDELTRCRDHFIRSDSAGSRLADSEPVGPFRRAVEPRKIVTRGSARLSSVADSEQFTLNFTSKGSVARFQVWPVRARTSGAG